MYKRGLVGPVPEKGGWLSNTWTIAEEGHPRHPAGLLKWVG